MILICATMCPPSLFPSSTPSFTPILRYRCFTRAVKIDPANDEAVAAFGRYLKEEADKIAVESTSKWFHSGDFFYDGQMMTSEREIPYRTPKKKGHEATEGAAEGAAGGTGAAKGGGGREMAARQKAKMMEKRKADERERAKATSENTGESKGESKGEGEGQDEGEGKGGDAPFEIKKVKVAGGENKSMRMRLQVYGLGDDVLVVAKKKVGDRRLQRKGVGGEGGHDGRTDSDETSESKGDRNDGKAATGGAGVALSPKAAARAAAKKAAKAARAGEFRMFVTGVDLQILSKRLDMKDLLKPQNRERLFHKLLDRLVFAFPSGGHVSSKRKKYTLAIEYREEPWYHMTHLSPAGYYLTVTAYMVEPPPWEAPWGKRRKRR